MFHQHVILHVADPPLLPMKWPLVKGLRVVGIHMCMQMAAAKRRCSPLSGGEGSGGVVWTSPQKVQLVIVILLLPLGRPVCRWRSHLGHSSFGVTLIVWSYFWKDFSLGFIWPLCCSEITCFHPFSQMDLFVKSVLIVWVGISNTPLSCKPWGLKNRTIV